MTKVTLWPLAGAWACFQTDFIFGPDEDWLMDMRPCSNEISKLCEKWSQEYRDRTKSRAEKMRLEKSGNNIY